MKRAISILFLGAGLAACGQHQPDRAPAASIPSAAPAGEVAATDEFGPFSAPVTDIALWMHPRLPFQGMVLVSTANGIVAFNIEDGAEAARIDSVDAKALELVYKGSGAEARGFAIALVPGADAFRFYEIDNESRSLIFRPTSGATGAGATAFCAGPNRDGALRLIGLSGGSIKSFAVEIGDASVEIKSASAHQAPQELTACVVDPLDGAVFSVAKTGAIYRMSSDGEIDADPFASPELQNAISIGLTLHGLVEGGATEECCGEIAVLDAADGGVRLFDRDDGRTLGSVRITSSFDVEGVDTATAMGIGFGNFGGIYRSGVLALATDGDDPAVRLVPFNGVMDALAAPMGPTADPRALFAEAEAEDDLIIDVEFVTE